MKAFTKFMVITLFIALLYISFPSASSISTTPKPIDYCTISCKGKKHTMCEYPKGGGPECTQFRGGISSGTQKNVLRDVHNTLRQSVAMGRDDLGLPPAANMVELVWSDEAAAIAQRWADQCTQGENHDVCRLLSDGENGGQNIAVRAKNNEYDVYQFQEKSVHSWYSNNITNFKKEDILHYKYNPSTAKMTQLIWARSEVFGCGFAFRVANGTQDDFRLICNYYPAGNIVGEPIFIEGKPCTKCPNARCSKDYPALCLRETSGVWNRGNKTQGVSYRPTPRHSSITVPLLSIVSVSYYIDWQIC